MPPKKTVAGIGSCLGLLEAFVPDISSALAHAPGGCAVDDVLDAMAAAWSAHRVISGTALVFGTDQGVDAISYPLRVVP